MKPLLPIIFFLFISHLSIAQGIDHEAKKFILDFYKSKYSSKYFIYTKGINSYKQTECIDILQNSDALRNWEKVNNKFHCIDSLILTNAEKQFIINELKNQTDTILWNVIDLPNSLSISHDTLTAIFKDNKKGWIYFDSAYGHSINSFNIPVFFRNNSLCAFYYDYTCGWLCGEGIFAIYRKEKDIWVLWITIFQWVS